MLLNQYKPGSAVEGAKTVVNYKFEEIVGIYGQGNYSEKGTSAKGGPVSDKSLIEYLKHIKELANVYNEYIESHIKANSRVKVTVEVSLRNNKLKEIPMYFF